MIKKESLDFLDNVDRDLNLVAETKRTKTRRQFEDWNQNAWCYSEEYLDEGKWNEGQRTSPTQA